MKNERKKLLGNILITYTWQTKFQIHKSPGSVQWSFVVPQAILCIGLCPHSSVVYWTFLNLPFVRLWLPSKGFSKKIVIPYRAYISQLGIWRRPFKNFQLGFLTACFRKPYKQSAEVILPSCSCGQLFDWNGLKTLTFDHKSLHCQHPYAKNLVVMCTIFARLEFYENSLKS